MTTSKKSREGGCLCGDIRYVAHGLGRLISCCHCSQCRRQTGHFYATIEVARDQIEIEGEENIASYRASDFASRAFCRKCGSALFWDGDNEDTLALMVGTLDDTSGMKIAKHIFTAHRGTYYALDGSIPQYPHDNGPSLEEV